MPTIITGVNVVIPAAVQIQWSPLEKVSANVLMFMTTFVGSDKVIVVDPYMISMMRGVSNHLLFFHPPLLW